MNEQVYLGIDLGAESGRVMAGAWNGRQLRVEELHRFSNVPVNIGDTLRWDALRLWSEIQHGLAMAARHFGDKVVSVGVDTWGVDFVLLTKSGEMLGQPYHYRDARVNGMFDWAFKRVPRAEIFAKTGLQFMELNTLYQLLALQRASPDLLAGADCLLMMPDFFHWCLCGSRVAEFTDATTSQCLNPTTRDWAFDLLDKFDLPGGIFPEIVPPGTEIGRLRQSVSARTGLGPIKVITPPTHDTASAVAAIPTGSTGKTTWAYISSGTWSLMGVETQNALLSDRVLQLNLTNEGGIDGTFRLLKNITGLWLVQQCKKAFEARGRNLDYAELARLAEESPPTGAMIDPDEPRLANPPDMPAAIQALCRETNQAEPQTEGALVRCALESLAARYSRVLEGLQEVTGTGVDVIHVVGGGSRNRLLNQLTADKCKRRVVAGPTETTVLGNLLSQVRAAGELKSLSEMREIVRGASELQMFEPNAG
ncbi:MAG TPA: rhamnulokinase family protein [Candidatus Baltobacteraceae bacterium]|nr:rhamnulokinase family protein [Candidatus Baltobacteraceae bacterium]